MRFSVGFAAVLLFLSACGGGESATNTPTTSGSVASETTSAPVSTTSTTAAPPVTTALAAPTTTQAPATQTATDTNKGSVDLVVSPDGQFAATVSEPGRWTLNVEGQGWAGPPVFVLVCSANDLTTLTRTGLGTCDLSNFQMGMPSGGDFSLSFELNVPEEGICIGAGDQGQAETGGACISIGPTNSTAPTTTPQAVPIACTSATAPITYTATADGTEVVWEFEEEPELSKMYLRTRPSGVSSDDHRNHHNAGFGLLWYQQVEVPISNNGSYQAELPSLQGPRATVNVDLVTVHPGGTECESRMFSDFEYPPLTSTQQNLSIPDGITVDLSRYTDLEVPAPTVEALVHAFASYNGRHISGAEEPDYSVWKIEDNKTIRDYSPKLRYFLFGSEIEIGNWWAVAQMMELVAAIAPHLDPRFATSIDEVNFPEFLPLCEPWMIVGVEPHGRQSKLQQPCQRDGNGAYFSDGTARSGAGNPNYSKSRGFTYHNKFVIEQSDMNRSDLGWVRNMTVGQEINNPCCTINFHETGHALGVDHNACGHSSMSFWEPQNTSYTTKPWNEDDLAGMAIHLDPRTTHGMSIEEAASALGIPKDARYQELVEKPWRACGNQDPGWDTFAERLYELHISTEGVETNHPTNRDKVTWSY